MPLNAIFQKPKNELETGGRAPEKRVETDIEMTERCPSCGRNIPIQTLLDDLRVCGCGHHLRMTARQRIDLITDGDSFRETDAGMTGGDIIGFPGYAEKLEKTVKASRESEAVICGTALIGNVETAIFVMEPYFMMGSMGTVAGEKITRLFELAERRGLNVAGVTVSGGARMQEGILSLMQMARTSGAVKRHSDSGGFYLAILTDPTTGGVTASFAMEGDITISEPGATIGFAGARVVEQTVRKKLPPGFQKAEILLEHGFIDMIVHRSKLKDTVAALLKMHRREDRTRT